MCVQKIYMCKPDVLKHFMYLNSLLHKNIMDKVDNVSEYHYQCKLICGDKNIVLLIQGTFEDSTVPAALKV